MNDKAFARALIMRCGRPAGLDGHACPRGAGSATAHKGYGPCRTHGRSQEHIAWRLALDVAAELDVSPWDALLLSVRKSAGRVAWVDAQLQETVRRNDGDMSVSEVRIWLKESRDERTLMAKMAKAAIDAGVAERMVRNVEMEGQIVAEVLGRVIDRLGLAPELRLVAFEEAHRQLLVLENPSGAPVEVQGTWNPIRDDSDGGAPDAKEEGTER